jgi:hypothetical protein
MTMLSSGRTTGGSAGSWTSINSSHGFCGWSTRLRLAEANGELRHSRPREGAERSGSVRNPCWNVEGTELTADGQLAEGIEPGSILAPAPLIPHAQHGLFHIDQMRRHRGARLVGFAGEDRGADDFVIVEDMAA